MRFAALLLWLAVSPKAVLTDDVYQIPAREWRYVEFVLKQRPVAVECTFQVVSRGEPNRVRLELLSKAELQHFLFSQPHSALASTGYESAGAIRLAVEMPGEYALVIANGPRSQSSTAVRLRLDLDFSGETEPVARYLSPLRRWTVVAISFAAFFAIVIVSGRKLLRAASLGSGR